MTLSRWLRDYLYISLGGNRKGVHKTYRNLFLTMLLGGLWHGAAWTFVIWGAIHGTGLCVERWWGERRKVVSIPDAPTGGGSGGGSAVLTATHTTTPVRQLAPAPNRLPTFVHVLITFNIVTFAWVFFRASSVANAMAVFGRLFSGLGPSPLVTVPVLLAIFAGLAVQFVPAGFWPSVQVRFAALSLAWQAVLYGSLLVVCFAIVGEQGVAPFIYFRF